MAMKMKFAAVMSTVNICVSSEILILMNTGIFGLIIMFVIPHRVGMLKASMMLINSLLR